MAALTALALSEAPKPLDSQKCLGHIDLMISGVHCANCIAKVEGGLRQMGGITAARLNFSTGRLSVDWDGESVSAKAIVQRIAELGFSAKPYDPASLLSTAEDEGRFLLRSIAIAGAGVVFVSGVTDTTIFGVADMGRGTLTLVRWLSALVAVPVTLLAGRVFFRSAIKGLRAGGANMDVPISLAILFSLALSIYQTAVAGAVTYYDAAVMLPFLLLIGRYLDYQLRRKAKGAALDLVAMQAMEAQRFDAAGALHAIATKLLVVGDRILLAPGERAPVDGILEGATDADLSLVTGESVTVPLQAGQILRAGSVVAGRAVALKVTARVEDSLVAELTRLIEVGQQQRSKYVRLADRAAAFYVPVVHGIALAVFVLWLMFFNAGLEQSLVNSIAVLIVTCPCALGLAVPAVQVVATGKLFRKGLLVKSGDALERLAEVDCVVFDKTGTLTEGRPHLLNGQEISPTMLAAAARLARASRHPLARALAAYAGSGPVAVGAVEDPGLGISVSEGEPARLGSPAWLGVSSDQACHASELCYRMGDGPIVRFKFGDKLRPDAAAAAKALRELGLDVVMLSGDRSVAAALVATQTGIGQWHAAVSPSQKVAHLNAMRAAGLHPLMVGDGLNDAAALASAHVSMSPGTAIDAAQAQADVVLRSPTLMPVVTAIKVARASRRLVLQNFAIAILYNVVAIPLAAGGLVTPLIAAVAMASSSLIVTLNALRLSWMERA